MTISSIGAKIRDAVANTAVEFATMDRKRVMSSVLIFGACCAIGVSVALIKTAAMHKRHYVKPPAEVIDPAPTEEETAEAHRKLQFGLKPKTPRQVLIDTAQPIAGNTITMLGTERAFECVHPIFAEKLSAAILEARDSGLPNAGVFSACRPPGLGVGGFNNKYDSLHAYGLAVDMAHIGAPSSSDARKWHAIAKKHGVQCIYGPDNDAEWNHCQGTTLHVAPRALRPMITKQGPRDLEEMWKVSLPFLDFAPTPQQRKDRIKRRNERADSDTEGRNKRKHSTTRKRNSKRRQADDS